MSRHFLTSLACAAAVGVGPSLHAQQVRFALAPASEVAVTKDVQYGRADTLVLRMDVYRPGGGASALPTLIFFNRALGASRSGEFYSAWARAAASRGLVAILPDLRGGNEAADFQQLITHLTTNGAAVGVDREAIAVYAGSGNVFAAFPVVEDPKMTAVKAAVMYYGSARVTQYRLDLPVLFVRAGLDRPDLNRDITAMASAAVTQNAPLTLLNHPGGYHAFEIANNDDATRDVMEQTIAWVKRVTARTYLSAVQSGVVEATAAGQVLSGNFSQAAATYATLVASRPDDARLRLSYGEALLGAQQFAAACAELEKLKGKGLGPRDLGLPAARACMQKGDPDAAIAWLKTIPTRFLPPSVQNEPVFAPLREREDFKTLFPAR